MRAAANSGGGAPLLADGIPIPSGTYLYHSMNASNGYSAIQISSLTSSVDVTFHLWGAAGGNGSYSTSGSSGAGGYARNKINFNNATLYYLYIGEGGKGPSQSNYGTGGDGGWPNGGYGSSGDATGAGGGGMTMLSDVPYSAGSQSLAAGNIILLAGGGGGSTGYNDSAGAGGGLDGQNAPSSASTGGTQSSGGQYNGSYLRGGNATGSQTSGPTQDDGGGGGGGLYGGGGGTSDANPGSGGSGYLNTNFTIGNLDFLVAGNFVNAHNAAGLLLPNYASGKQDINGVPQNGFDGLVYIEY